MICHPAVAIEDLEPGDPLRVHLEEVERRRLAAVAELDRLERKRRRWRIARQGIMITFAFPAGHLWAKPRQAG
jgi:hypothetical protein